MTLNNQNNWQNQKINPTQNRDRKFQNEQRNRDLQRNNQNRNNRQNNNRFEN